MTRWFPQIMSDGGGAKRLAIAEVVLLELAIAQEAGNVPNVLAGGSASPCCAF